jgi:hypothetical protein
MCNFSPSIDSDDEFVNLIQNLMGMSGLKNPPPAEYLSFKGSKTHAPIAKQSHGDYITWNQEKSALERETEYKAAGIGKKVSWHIITSAIDRTLCSINDELRYIYNCDDFVLNRVVVYYNYHYYCEYNCQLD